MLTSPRCSFLFLLSFLLAPAPFLLLLSSAFCFPLRLPLPLLLRLRDLLNKIDIREEDPDNQHGGNQLLLQFLAPSFSHSAMEGGN